MSNTAPKTLRKSVSEERWGHVDMRGPMSSRADVTIVGASVTIDEHTIGDDGTATASSDLTFTNAGANTSRITSVDGRTDIPVGKAVEFFVSGGVAGKTYRITITAETNGLETVVGRVHLKVDAD